MLDDGLDIEVIFRTTGLDRRAINKLAKKRVQCALSNDATQFRVMVSDIVRIQIACIVLQRG